jgi:hypothetical protein
MSHTLNMTTYPHAWLINVTPSLHTQSCLAIPNHPWSKLHILIDEGMQWHRLTIEASSALYVAWQAIMEGIENFHFMLTLPLPQRTTWSSFGVALHAELSAFNMYHYITRIGFAAKAVTSHINDMCTENPTSLLRILMHLVDKGMELTIQSDDPLTRRQHLAYCLSHPCAISSPPAPIDVVASCIRGFTGLDYKVKHRSSNLINAQPVLDLEKQQPDTPEVVPEVLSSPTMADNAMELDELASQRYEKASEQSPRYLRSSRDQILVTRDVGIFKCLCSTGIYMH